MKRLAILRVFQQEQARGFILGHQGDQGRGPVAVPFQRHHAVVEHLAKARTFHREGILGQALAVD